MLSCFCFWLLRTLVLRHDNAYQRAFYVLVGAVAAPVAKLCGVRAFTGHRWHQRGHVLRACALPPRAALAAALCNHCPLPPACYCLQPLVVFIVAWFITIFTIKESTQRWELHETVRPRTLATCRPAQLLLAYLQGCTAAETSPALPRTAYRPHTLSSACNWAACHAEQFAPFCAVVRHCLLDRRDCGRRGHSHRNCLAGALCTWWGAQPGLAACRRLPAGSFHRTAGSTCKLARSIHVRHSLIVLALTSV